MSNAAAMNRLCGLFDENSFVEMASLVTARSTDFNLEPAQTPSDGVVTGHGLVNGILVFAYSQDVSVLGGSVGEMHAKKIAAVYDMALKMGAPVVGFLDCAGVRLQEAGDALDGLGLIYRKMTEASGIIPQITAVMGNCGGGMSLLSALSDFTFMEQEKGRLYVNAPNTIAGNHEQKCDSAAAAFQAKEAGTVDVCGSESEILTQIRELVELIPGSNEENGCMAMCTDELNRASLIGDIRKDARAVAAELSDSRQFFETKRGYAPSMVTGFIRLNGRTVGVVANSLCSYGEDGTAGEEYAPEITADGAEKAADFISFCDAFDLPVLTIVQSEGFAASLEEEKALPRALARLVSTLSAATVAKVSLLVGKAYGSAAVMMNAKAIGADLVYALPDAQLGMMDAKLASQIMYAGEPKAVQDEKAKEYEALQSNIVSAARRGYVDALVEPVNARKYLIDAFELLATKRQEISSRKHITK